MQRAEFDKANKIIELIKEQEKAVYILENSMGEN